MKKNDNEWIIIPEDDELVPDFDNTDELVEDYKLISPEEWSDINRGDIIFVNANVQHVGEELKRRPMLVLFKSGDHKNPYVKGFQVTTQEPSANGFRSKFKSPLEDWAEEGLKKKSYINFDHFVENIDSNIKEHFPYPVWITADDAKLLLKNIKDNYAELIKISYSRIPGGVDLLNKVIEFLEKY